MQTFSGLAILTVLWFVIGFSLVYATSNGGFIGGFEWIFFNNVPFEEPLDYAPTIPGISFATYQMMFAVITPLLITGAFAERLTWNAFFVFIIAWSIFIYYPLAHWVWGIVLGLASYYMVLLLKQRLKLDDALDMGSVHGITGIIGSLAIGLVASSLINPSGPNGLLYGNAAQLGIQALGVAVAAVLGFGGTIIIMKVINAIMGLRVKEVEEEVGLDITEQGETAYGEDWGV